MIVHYLGLHLTTGAILVIDLYQTALLVFIWEQIIFTRDLFQMARLLSGDRGEGHVETVESKIIKTFYGLFVLWE